MNNKRLASLDILRGFDLWLLLFFGPIVGSYCNIEGVPFRDFLSVQCEHPEWNGFVLWDIIMPLFMFMSGITIPFSMYQYREGVKPGKEFWMKIARRFILLFFLGWIVQGNLLTFDFKQFHPFANTLQAIAVSYVVAAIAYVYGGVKLQTIVASICFIAYFMCFALNGQLNPDIQDNVAMWVDEAILGSHRDGVVWAADGTWSYNTDYRYTWILSSLNFVVTGVMGCMTGHLLRNSKKSPQNRVAILLITGIVLIIVAFALGQITPINKKIWNNPMTLLAGGFSCIMMAITYYIVDVKGWSKGLNWLKYFGMNSIFAYCIGEVINFSSISKSVLYGFNDILGEFYPVLIATSNVIILLLILRHLYKKNIFFKV